MRVLITGATGLVGTAIVNEMHALGYDVNYLTTRKAKITNKKEYQGFYWNPTKGEIDLDCFKGVNGIINLAGATISKKWTSSYKKELVLSRTQSLQTLKQGLLQSGIATIKSFVSASAIGIYPSSYTSLYTEGTTEVDTSFLGNVVKAWEKEIDTFDMFDFPVAKIRIGLVLSDKGGALPKMVMPIKNLFGAAFGSGEQWQSWIHIKDLSRMFVFCLNNGLEGTYNGVAPNPITNTKLTAELAKILKRPLLLPNVPKFAMHLLLGEMAYLLFASQRVSSKAIEEEGFEFNYLNICRALESFYERDKGEQRYRKEYI